MRAGFPATMACGGTLRVTTAPAPITARSPMVTPGSSVAFAPMDAPDFHQRALDLVLRWKVPICKCRVGAYEDIVLKRDAVPKLDPSLHDHAVSHHTSFSMNVWPPILHSAPILAPERMWANASIRVPGPMHAVSTIAEGCWTMLTGRTR